MAAAAAVAQAPDYFPLAVGNVWVYRMGGTPRPGETDVTVEVTRRGEFNGVDYYELSEFRRGRYWVRADGGGRVWRYDEQNGEERLWYDFSRGRGEQYETALPTCCGRAQVADTRASRKVALGEFERAFYRLTYPGVFQVGITEENFLPYVGLVYREENTGGPSFRTQDLVYARISGVTVLNASGVGFGVALGNGYARLFLNNNTGAPLRVVFASGQTYELVLRDGAGKEVYRWGEGKGFTQALRGVDLAPGETSWVVEMRGVAGAETLTAELVTVGPKFTATIPVRKGAGGN
ncbi:MAG: hypothetical protein JNM66_15300 [Bryobacterales bacterium]|nr:hypothetical protein [Bryobacterales bacterium]